MVKINRTKTRKRICIFMGRYTVGGHATLTKEYKEAFEREGHEVLLVAGVPQEGEPLLKNFPPAVLMKFYKRNIHPVFDILLFFEFFWTLFRFKPDVLFTETAKAGFVGRFVGWVYRVPLIIHIFQGHTLLDFFDPKTSKKIQTLEKLASHWCHKVILPKKSDVSLFAKELKIVSESQIFIPKIPLHIHIQTKDECFCRKKILSRLQLPQSSFLIGTLCRLAPIKRLDIAVQVFCEHMIKNPDRISVDHLIIPGNGPEEKRLKELSTQFSNNIHFIGSLSLDEVPEFYSGIDLFFHPSDHEGHGIVTIEALLYGRVVVCSHQGLITDFISNRKIIVPCSSSLQEWTLALEKGIQSSCHQHSLSLEEKHELIRQCDELFSIEGAQNDMMKLINAT